MRKSTAIVIGALFLCVLSCDITRATGTFQDEQSTAAARQNIEHSLMKLRSGFDLQEGDCAIIVDISEQRLYLVEGGRSIVKSYQISSSKYGVGSLENSYKTPLGTHQIARKHGEDAGIGAIFRSQIMNGDMATIYTDMTDTEEDYITTRVLMLRGIEEGINSGGEVDSFNRCIYIHGTHEEGLIGTPASSGCIRMRNTDIVELFGLVREGTLVEIRQ